MKFARSIYFRVYLYLCSFDCINLQHTVSVFPRMGPSFHEPSEVSLMSLLCYPDLSNILFCVTYLLFSTYITKILII